MFDPETGEQVFGAGIQYGLLFQSACETVPTSASVALMNISWDGGDTGFGGRSATPIVLQVMNTNSMSTKAAALVGYLPKLEVAKGFKNDKNYGDANKFVLQVYIHTLTLIYNLFVYRQTNTSLYTHNDARIQHACIRA